MVLKRLRNISGTMNNFHLIKNFSTNLPKCWKQFPIYFIYYVQFLNYACYYVLWTFLITSSIASIRKNHIVKIGQTKYYYNKLEWLKSFRSERNCWFRQHITLEMRENYMFYFSIACSTYWNGHFYVLVNLCIWRAKHIIK